MKKIKLSNKAQKRILAALLVIAIFATSIINDAFVPETKASSVTSHTAIQMDIKDQAISAIGTTKTLMWLTVKDGTTYRSVYCLEHGKHFNSGKSLNSLDTILDDLGYQSKHKTTLAYLLYYGYSNSSTTLSSVYNKATNTKSTRESVEYMATQTLVWMLSKDVELNRHVFPDNTDRSKYINTYNSCIEQMAALIPSNSITVGSNTYNSQVYFKIYANQLADKVYQAQYKMQPSFAIKTNNNSSNISTATNNASKSPIKLKWDKSKNAYVGTITDSTKTALSHYIKSGKFSKTTFYKGSSTISNPGVSFSFSKTSAANDTLTITAKEPLTGTTAVVVPANSEYKNFIGNIDKATITWSFGIDEYQPAAEEGELTPDPVNMAFALSTPNTTAEINIIKTDVVTGDTLAGVTFRLYEYDTASKTYKSTSTTKTTKEDGKVTFKVEIGASNAGKYRVYEESNPKEYYFEKKCVFDSSNVMAKAYGKNKVLEPGDKVTIPVTNPPYRANITVVKQGKYLDKLDANGNFKFSSTTIKLSGAKFGLYLDKDCTKPVEKDYAGNKISNTATSDASGLVKWTGLTPGKYYVKEISANTGYNRLTDIKTVDVGINSTTATFNKQTISQNAYFTNPPTTFVFNIVKKDSENNQTIEGIKFTLYTSEDMYNKDGKLIVKKDTAIRSAYTDANGKISFKDLPTYAYNASKKYTSWKGKFYVKETGKKSGTEAMNYVINNGTKFYYSNSTLNVTNPPIKGTVTLFKTGDTLSGFAGVNKGFVFDSKKNLAGVKFQLIAMSDIKDGQGNVKYKKNAVLGTYTTNSKGQITVSNLYPGSYGFKETQTGAEYILDTTTETFVLNNSSNSPTAKVTVNNELYELKVGVYKKDKNNNQPIPNTYFDVYTKYAIKNEAGKVIVPAKTLVATAVTDAEGKFTVGKLAKGTYYIKETKAAPGFALDTTEVNLYAPTKETALVYKDVYNEQVMAELEVNKTGKELSAFKDGEFEFNSNKPLKDVVFSLYAKEDIKDALGNPIYSTGTLVATETTDENGKILFTGLVQGKYTLKEESVPEGHIISKESYDIDLTTKDSTKKVFTVKQSVSNAYDTGEVVVTKKDKETLDVIEGTTLGIYAAEDIANADGTVIVKKDQLIKEAVTNEEGKVTFDNLPHNQFYIKEIEPSDGYKLSDEKVATGEIFIEPIELDYYNEKMQAKLTVYKIGEEISKVTQSEVAFEFNNQVPLANVSFNLYAYGDVLDADGEVVYADGEAVATLTTDKNGRAVNYNLIPGKYKLVETETNEDYYLDSTEHIIDLTYSDGTSVPQQTVNINNIHKKYFIDLVKANEYTGEGLQGSTYGIFAAADIKDKTGKVVADKDQLVAKGVTDADGKVLFSGLDEADYYIQEMSAPDGFNISPVKYPVSKEDLVLVEIEIEDEPAYEGSTDVDGTGTITSVDGGVNVVVTDIPIEVEFDKIDIVSGELLADCELEIYTSEGKLYKKFTTTNESFKITAMPAGDYVLKEVKSVTGYSLAENVKFTVKQVGGVQKVTMVNKRTTCNFTVEKRDELTNKLLKGAKFEITNSAGELVDTIVTNDKGVATSKNLEMCYYDAQGVFIEKAVYYVKEIECPKHLVTADVYIVEFDDTQINTPNVQIKQTVLNYPVTDVVLMKMSVHDKPLEDALYAIYDEEGYLVEQVRTDKNGEAVFSNAKLEKVYSFKELAAPNGYAVNPNVYSFVAHTDGTIEGSTMIRDDDATIAISKVDTDTLEALPGAEFELCDLDGKVIMTAISDEYGYAEFKGVLRGSYTIHESDAPAGYDISGQIINIEVTSSYVNSEPILMKNSKTVQTGVEETQMPDNTKMIILSVIIILMLLLIIALVVIPIIANRRIKY